MNIESDKVAIKKMWNGTNPELYPSEFEFKKEIDFFTFMTVNSLPYAAFLKKHAEKFASGNIKINWKCILSIEGEEPEGFKCYKQRHFFNVNGKPKLCSVNRGFAMSEALRHIESRYVVFIDVDSAILYPDWDELIVEKLKKYSLWGNRLINLIKGSPVVPSVVICAFNAEILKRVALDFRANRNKKNKLRFKYKIKNDIDSVIFNKKRDEEIKCDVGWMLPIAVKEAGILCEVMPGYMSNSSKILLPFKDSQQKKDVFEHQAEEPKAEYMSEWHYNKRIFITHKYGSRNEPFDGKWGKIWQDRIAQYDTITF